ncbi:MAG: hypothetical protein DRG30_02185 [Epsilonproteobacteria bacterium]|nr:MAG: hypothetical protein DRG30_02185 [Campylobacterota bacterium]
MAKSTYFKGGAELSWQRKNSDGTYGIQQELFPIVNISIETSVEWTEAYNRSGCMPLLALKLPSKTDMQFNFGTETFVPNTFAMAWMGVEIAETQAAETDAALSIVGTLVEQGGIIDIKKFNVEGLIVAAVGGTPVYDLGVDYSFNSARGYVVPIKDGGIADGTPLDLTLGTVPEISYTTVATMKDLTLEGRFIIDTNSQVGNNYRMIIKNATIASEGTFEIIGDEVGKMEFTGSALVDVDTVTGTYSDYIDVVEMNNSSCDKIS